MIFLFTHSEGGLEGILWNFFTHRIDYTRYPGTQVTQKLDHTQNLANLEKSVFYHRAC
jgi:hypothetical protein